MRSALISSVDPKLPSEDVAFQFLRYVDELRPPHLHILSCLARNIGQFARAESLEQVVVSIRTPLAPSLDRVTLRLFVHDLDARFLIRLGDLGDLPEFASKASFLAFEASAKKPLEVTSLGPQFLDFIHDQRA